MINTDEFKQRAKALEEKYNRIVAKPYDSRNKFEGMVIHEIGTKANSAIGFYNLLEDGSISNEEFEAKYLPHLVKNLQISERIIDLASIKSFKKSNLFSDEETSSKAVLKELVSSEADYLEKNNIQVKFIGNDGETNLKPSVLYSLFGTLLGNAIKFTVPDSQINIFVRTYKDKFTLEMENYHDAGKPRRTDIGLGKGLGKEFSEKIIKALDGTVEKTDKPFFMPYLEGKDFYGVRFKIPNANSRLENIVDEDDN